MRIQGIDASLKSTGVCVLDVVFISAYADTLLKILLNKDVELNDEEKIQFNESLSIVEMTQIQSSKVWEKDLAKTRKRIRDDSAAGQPSQEDIDHVENVLDQRVEYQVDNICNYNYELKPDITLIEDYSFHSQGSLVQLAEMKGALKINKNFNMIVAPIGSVKKVGSTKGNGNKAVMYDGIQRFPFDGVTFTEGNDDEIDALAICLATFYSTYHRVIGFEFPKGKTSKEKTQIKAWQKSLNLFANHIGNKVDMERLINGK